MNSPFLSSKATDEWDSLTQQIADSGYPRAAEADDLIAIVTGDRDRRFNTGLDMILTGLIRATPAPPDHELANHCRKPGVHGGVRKHLDQTCLRTRRH